MSSCSRHCQHKVKMMQGWALSEALPIFHYLPPHPHQWYFLCVYTQISVVSLFLVCLLLEIVSYMLQGDLDRLLIPPGSQDYWLALPA